MVYCGHLQLCRSCGLGGNDGEHALSGSWHALWEGKRVHGGRSMQLLLMGCGSRRWTLCSVTIGTDVCMQPMSSGKGAGCNLEYVSKPSMIKAEVLVGGT